MHLTSYIISKISKTIKIFLRKNNIIFNLTCQQHWKLLWSEGKKWRMESRYLALNLNPVTVYNLTCCNNILHFKTEMNLHLSKNNIIKYQILMSNKP